jgi:carboxypeptidase C (cathepsin A)
MLKRTLLVTLCLALALTGPGGLAQDTAPKGAKAEQQQPQEAKDTQVQTTHSATIGGAKVDYQATAGTIVLKSDAGKPTAAVFYVAYTRTGVKDPAARPLTFAFNGGPGSSAVWLHLGCLGPRRVVVPENGERIAPPYRLVDNESSLLDVTDLVFIDPVSTGLSRPAPGQDAKKFHGVEGDVQSVGEFIRLYVTRNDRWNSPKFLVGESYGTTRASLLVDHLQRELGMNFNGVVLVAPALNFQTFVQTPSNDLAFTLFLPGYTAAAWYHKKLAPEVQADLQRTLEEARKFARTEYSQGLFRGSALSADERRHLAERVAHFTGLDAAYVLRKDFRITVNEFMERLLAHEQQIVGRFDSRIKGAHRLDDPIQQPYSDPSDQLVQGPFTAALNDYLRHELHYASDLPYETLNLRVQPWDWGQPFPVYLDVSDKLSRALKSNPNLRVLVATGYYDLATSFMGTEYTVSHLGLPPGLTDRIGVRYYEAGHMMYVHRESRHKLKQDLTQFWASTLTAPPATPLTGAGAPAGAGGTGGGR